ncbi:MSC_0624 family F1-like ATPase-associated membrane protein [Mycoplasmopsis sturni]|uniref:MSC_0624 family F1-like ATPase-associated membrane protein n=1 Tax=Mycoplasmopsis sturni TaxID=39047 RepID=UPI0005656B1B|nr:hypothetical protein [Mycoplasmopsis sturni]
MTSLSLFFQNPIASFKRIDLTNKSFYKKIILLFSFISALIYLFIIPQFLNYQDLFDATSVTAKAESFSTLMHSSIFVFASFAFYWYNYRYLDNNIQKLKYYFPWFIIYLLFGVLSGLLLIFWKEFDNYLHLVLKSVFLILIWIINFAYETYYEVLKFKSSPISKKSFVFFIVAQISKLITLGIGILALFFFVTSLDSSGKIVFLNKNNLFYENDFVKTIQNTFFSGESLSVLYSLLVAIAFAVLFILFHFNFWFGNFKETRIKVFVKNLTFFSFSVISALVIWYFSYFFINKYEQGIIEKQKLLFYPFIIYFVINFALIFGIVFTSNYRKTRSVIIPNLISLTTIYFILSSSLLLVFESVWDDLLMRSVNYLVTIISWIVIFFNYKKYNNDIATIHRLQFLVIMLSIIFIIVTDNLNVILLSQKPSNYALNVIPVPLKISDFALLLILLVNVSILLYNAIKLAISLSVVTLEIRKSQNSNIKEGHYEN